MSTARDEQIEAAAEEIYDAVQAAVPHSIPGHRAIEAILRRHFAADDSQPSLSAALTNRKWPMMSRGVEIGSTSLAPCAVQEIIRLCKKHFADVEGAMVGGIRCRLLAKYRGGIYICDDETTQLALTLDGRWVHREQGHVFDGLEEARAHISAHADQGDKSVIGRGKK